MSAEVNEFAAKVRGVLESAVAAIGGQTRSGQVAMAEAVANALENRNHLLVQAGTGTGKSLAYLVPAIAHGKRVLVATATLALQRQLVERDLPRIQPALEKALGKKFKFAIYKGVGNYICLQKMNGAGSDVDAEPLLEITSLEKDAKRLKEWANKPGVSGDRDDAPDVDRRVWAANSLSGRECIGRDDCPFGGQCFAALAKDKAMSADVVITNHTLLAIEIVDSHPILPERDAIILDEAHEFMDRTTAAVTEEITAARVERAAKMAKKYLGGKVSLAFEKAADEFAEEMREFAEDARIDPTLTGRLPLLPSVLESPMRKVKEAAAAVIAVINSESDSLEADALAERARVKGATQEVLTTVTKMLKPGDTQVLWFEPTFSALYLAPLQVSHLLRQNLLRQTPVIATSATLTVGKSFKAIAGSIGFSVDEIEDAMSEDEAEIDLAAGEIDPGNVAIMDVGSPFDFASQGMLYLPRHIPEPTKDGINTAALDEIGLLIEAAGGRTLALFSSWRALEAADEYLRKILKDLKLPIITQRRGDAVAPLVDRFAKEPSSVLLGTITLWQGIDVPGPACTLVTIDRIPFPRPDEPVLAARSAKADAAGGSGFRQVSLPRAALLLAQGTGRLIRSTSDRGVVAIMDSRIVTKSYGRMLLDSMPPFWRTSDGAVVRAALTRLDAQFREQDS